MNYIREINAFYDWLETNSLSTSGIVLWHALMAINNKAGWAAEFTVALSVLCVKTGLSSRAITNARNELKQKGRIDWKQRKGNQSAIYKMISLLASGAYNCSNNTTDNYTNNNLSAPHADSYADNTSNNGSDKCASNASTLNKLNKTKLNINDHDNNAREDFQILAIFEKEFARPLSPIEVDRIMYWLNQDPLTDELIFEALKRAVMRGKLNFGYIDAILLDWSKNNVRTIQDVGALDEQFKGRKYGKQDNDIVESEDDYDPYYWLRDP